MERVTDNGFDPAGPELLSVVIVTYNEQERISDCIESILSATRDLVDVEIVLVDSNSTDRTVDIASRYPVTVLRIPDDSLTTPGAGRYVGTGATSGERVLFVDGDMVIQSPWVKRALTTMRTRDDVAGVDGHLNTPSESGLVTEVGAVRGVALYSRDRLQAVGGFDPYLQSLEDIHLGYKLTTAGHTLLRLPEVAAEHPSPKTLSEPLRRLRRGYTVGSGQALRRSIGSTELFRKHLYRVRYRLAMVAWLCLGIGSLLFYPALMVWLALSVAAGGILSRRRGVKWTAGFLLTKLFGTVGIVRGASTAPRPPESFPVDSVETLHHGTVVPASSSAVVDAGPP